jgi:16S rRNA (adenine1518-N6/adenine1519-N6)-dimethyltransferase
MDRKEIALVLAAAGARPRHAFGQNFMVDQNILAAIVAAGNIAPHDVVLEIGPGVGNLTRLLAHAASGGAVLAVDIDRKLMPAAQRHHAELTNVTWLNADVLAGKHTVEPRVLETLKALAAAHPEGHVKLVSNLPYNAASPLIAELLVEIWRGMRTSGGSGHMAATGAGFWMERMAFTVQWEVALRMTALPDTRDFGPLGVLIQALAEVEIVRKIPPGAFWPPPKIHSALVVVRPSMERMSRVSDAEGLQNLLAGIFAHRRQTLGNALKHHLAERWTPEFKGRLDAFDLGKRPENFSVEDLIRLAELCRS